MPMHERRRLRKRIASLWDMAEWPLVVLLALTALGLGVEGFSRQLEDAGWDHVVYRAVQLFALESGSLEPPMAWELEVARFLAPAVTVYAAARAIASVFREHVQLLRARFWRGHVVIVGLGERGRLLAKGFADRGDRVLVIERNQEVDAVAQAREQGVPVVIGDASDDTVLAKARVPYARYLVAVANHDGINAEVAVDAGRLVAERGDGDLEAFVHLVDRRLCELVREGGAGRGTQGSFRLRFFNVYETGARAWLTAHPPFHLDDGNPHLLVVGVGQIGASLVVGAARQWLALHPETALSGHAGPRITLVDRVADAKRGMLELRHPALRRFAELEAVELEVDSPEFERAEFLGDTVSTVYVCLDDDSTGLKAALTLVRSLRGRPDVPVVVRMRQEAGLALLRAHEAPNLHAFHLLDSVCNPESLLGQTRTEILARRGHEEYLREQEAGGATPETNPSMVPWEDLPEEKRESNRRHQDHALVKLRAIGCDIVPLDGTLEALERFDEEEVELMAELEHDRWMAEQLFEGWTYAPGPKDPVRRTHNALVPYDRLPYDVKELDRMVVRRLPEFLAAGGYRIVRR